MAMNLTALIADDEPLLRASLRRQLAECWPELLVVAEARNGPEALALFERHQPTVCFLDVHMPGLSGVDVASQIGRRAHLVFVTAYDQYAVRAFEQGALDYLVKPVQLARLAGTVTRLRERLATIQPGAASETLLRQLAAYLQAAPAPGSAPAALRWLRASVGPAVRLIPVDDVDYLKSDDKYTLVAWRDGGKPAEALLRNSLRELLVQLDPQQFQQIHRAVVVNLHAVRQVVRGAHETAEVTLKHRPEVLPVSRSFLHLFKAE
ncbi:LytTR family DNA-binding domain-containing protein [Janthinobacterium sp. PAMC25594]|uniref:LytR/AlgR family response regulator transcription factor n=1 Tax=Janthinobacterium sp. PAMC25594 TaxID=2861284 RepID=UPI001C6359CB|nr:LytTR family DNA-binding domain-containing protein [Janthinobacterium sp. PAMC25594]QYG07782.1 LytTR family DNA-binding domain-containing protein [Janthinobacterium sp. PAMC25594]